MNLQWRALAACGGVLALVGVSRRGPATTRRWIAVVVAAVPVLVVLTPLVEAVWLAVGLALAPVIAVLIGLAVLSKPGSPAAGRPRAAQAVPTPG